MFFMKPIWLFYFRNYFIHILCYHALKVAKNCNIICEYVPRKIKQNVFVAIFGQAFLALMAGQVCINITKIRRFVK